MCKRGRAQKNGVPLTYMEIVGLWNTFIVPSSINLGAVDKAIDDKMKQFMKSRGPPPSPNLTSSPKKPRLTKDEYGQDWNTSKSLGGCMSGGKYLRHSCSKKTPTGRTCGSEGHRYYTH